MDYRDAIDYLEESKCDQRQGEGYQEKHNEVLDIAIKAIENQIFFENQVSNIHTWFVDNKDCLLDSAMKVANEGFKNGNADGYIDDVDLDFIVEDIVDEIQKGILNVLDSYIEEMQLLKDVIIIKSLPLRLALLGYNRHTTEQGLRYFINNNIEQIKGTSWRDKKICLKDGSTIKGITSVDEQNLRGKRFDQLILFDDNRWNIKWHREEDIRIIKVLTMYCSIIPDEFQIIDYEYMTQPYRSQI